MPRTVQGLPRWVKLFAITGGIVIVGLVVAMMAGHGPWQHLGNH